MQHIQKSWQRGKEAVDALRAQLSTTQQDGLCLLVDGGVNLHKLYGVMHDTCSTANLVAQLIIELQQRQKRNYLTEEVRSQACAPEPSTLTLFPILFRFGNCQRPRVKHVLIFSAAITLETCPSIVSIKYMINGWLKSWGLQCGTQKMAQRSVWNATAFNFSELSAA